jgi:hypothetical protein
MPSAQSIYAEGVDLGAFCMALLKKVEELSLYVLQQHDRLARLERTASL